MKLTFDQKGFLKPYEKVVTDLTTFESYFVQNFENSITRNLIFQAYKVFLSDFAEKVTPDFKHSNE
jgi:hypothetical protein